MHAVIRGTLVGCALLSAASSLLAGTLTVPGSYATLQDAIDNAQSGDVIRVLGGTHPPIVIDKPLTIVGSPKAVIDNSMPRVLFGELDPAITLDGPGGGRVALVNLTVDNTVNGFSTSGSAPPVAGGGFASLFVSDCLLEAPDWVQLTGVGVGQAGIDVVVPYVFVTSSVVRASPTAPDTDSIGPLPNSADGIHAPFSAVFVFDSTVEGADGPFTKLFECGVGPCPCAGIGGAAGAGIVAASVVTANSTITGGQGGLVLACIFGRLELPGAQADAPAIEAAEVVPLGNALSDDGPLALGASWTLTWNTPAPTALLLLSTKITPPVSLSKGLLFLDATTLTLIPVPSGGPHQLTATLPTLPSLVGTPVGVQLYDPVRGLTRPVFNVFQVP